MKKHTHMKNLNRKRFLRQLYLSLVSTLFFVFCALSSLDAKVYIDITDPGFSQIPLKITTEGSSYASEIKWIAKNDLEKTGMFSFVAPGVPGAEVVANISAEPSDRLKILLTVTDLIELYCKALKMFSNGQETMYLG